MKGYNILIPLWWMKTDQKYSLKEQEASLLTDFEDGSIREVKLEQREPHSRTLAQLLALTGHILTGLKPAWAVSSKPRRLHPTSWLDGVRGTAAFFVFIHHYSQIFNMELRHGWDHEQGFLQLPIIRIIYSGASMVAVFFIVSGYALSFKPLLLAREEDFPKLFTALVSSTFRRGIRLYIPCAVIMLVSATTSYLGLFAEGAKDRVARSETLSGILWIWLNDLIFGVFPYEIKSMSPFTGSMMQFEPNLWTIPYEFRGSIVVFMTILAVAKARDLIRIGLIFAFVVYLVVIGQWDIFLFASGMLCCEVHFWFEDHFKDHSIIPRSNHISFKRTRSGLQVFKILLSATVLLFTLYLLSMPEQWEALGEAPLYQTLIDTTPNVWQNHPDAGRFWPCLSAVALIFIVDRTPFLQKIFTFRFPQYLGQVSFSLYIVHAYLLNTIGRRLAKWTNDIAMTALPDHIGNVVGRIFCLALFSPVMFWVADLLTRYVDEKSVKLAKWMEVKCFKEQRVS